MLSTPKSSALPRIICPERMTYKHPCMEARISDQQAGSQQRSGVVQGGALDPTKRLSETSEAVWRICRTEASPLSCTEAIILHLPHEDESVKTCSADGNDDVEASFEKLAGQKARYRSCQLRLDGCAHQRRSFVDQAFDGGEVPRRANSLFINITSQYNYPVYNQMTRPIDAPQAVKGASLTECDLSQNLARLRDTNMLVQYEMSYHHR